MTMPAGLIFGKPFSWFEPLWIEYHHIVVCIRRQRSQVWASGDRAIYRCVFGFKVGCCLQNAYAQQEMGWCTATQVVVQRRVSRWVYQLKTLKEGQKFGQLDSSQRFTRSAKESCNIAPLREESENER